MHPELAQAMALLHADGYTCVLKRGDSLHCDRRRGVAPLLSLLDSGVDTTGGSAADKVVGKGAAMLYRLLGVARVYADVMSKPAQQALECGGIEVHYATLVDAIADRSGTGLCPMEQAALPTDDPSEALIAIRNKLAQLRQ